MRTVIKDIYDWQVEAGNAERPYDDKLEDSFTVEESLEQFSNVENPKFASRVIMSNAGHFTGTDVDRLDKACDKIVFAIGSMAKLGLDVDQINEALSIVNNANKQKLGMKRDEKGKLMKPANFKEPQKDLQKLLNEEK